MNRFNNLPVLAGGALARSLLSGRRVGQSARSGLKGGAVSSVRLRRAGLTLIELLIAMSIMAMVVGSLGALAYGVQSGFEYTEGRGIATQHARVVLDRITQRVEQATTSERFPGFLVVPYVEGGAEFPEVLVVWHPSGKPSNPTGLPRYNELVIYAPDRTTPSQLLEITAPLDSRTVPPPEDLARWRSELNTLRNSWRSRSFVLTNLLRKCSVPGATGDSRWRGAVRLKSRLRPSEADWALYHNGERDWTELPWVQGIYGSRTGMRQASLQIEIQLVPGDTTVLSETNTHIAVPFFGAASLYYHLER